MKSGATVLMSVCMCNIKRRYFQFCRCILAEYTTIVIATVTVVTTSTLCHMYTVGHKKRATFIFTITLANVDRFQ